MATKTEIWKALTIIQETCENTSECQNCILNVDKCCGITAKSPISWKLNVQPQEQWKPFVPEEM